jgi:hypothetical protein
VIADFAAGRRAAESAFIDTCRITRDPQAVGDDYRDYGTGEMVEGADDASAVYEGPCMFRPAADRRGEEDRSGASMYEQHYRVRLPMSSPEIKIGDVLSLTVCTMDPHMVGAPVVVTRVDGGTASITRILTCTAERRGPAQ